MNKQDAIKKLKEIDQEQLLKSAGSFDLERVLKQIDQLDLAEFKLQQSYLLNPPKPVKASIESFLDYSSAGNQNDFAAGKQLIAKGLMGCLIVAGGQGTRLRFNGPKGMFGVTPIKNKSLFQLLSEKTAAASKQANRLLPLAIMTSPLNHKETVYFFQEHQYFGLDPLQVTFFSQGMLPFLDAQGNLVLTPQGAIAEGPDGNGSSLKHFYDEGIWKQWHEQGIQYLNYILIDNALADPFDAELLGNHVRQSAEITLKCTYRLNAQENVGVVVKNNGRVQVMEYAEMPAEERFATEHDGSLKYPCANLSTFCFSMETVKNAALHNHSLMPLHLTFKPIPEDPSHQKKAWKFEQFIFDLLPHTDRVNALLYPREICFAPLKNFSGDDSLATVQAALIRRDQQIIEQITQKKCAANPIEISPEFYYPLPKLLRKWRGKEVASGYIDP